MWVIKTFKLKNYIFIYFGFVHFFSDSSIKKQLISFALSTFCGGSFASRSTNLPTLPFLSKKYVCFRFLIIIIICHVDFIMKE